MYRDGYLIKCGPSAYEVSVRASCCSHLDAMHVCL